MDDQLQLSLETVDPAAFPGTPSVPVTDDVGWRGPEVCQLAGITYRQLDYWARTKLAPPSIKDAAGSGSKRLYSYRDVLVIKTIAQLLDAGVSLQNIRVVAERLAELGDDDLASTTLLADKTTVYALTTAEEVVDILNGCQGVFGIALGGLIAETNAKVLQMPGQPLAGADPESARDEFTAHRERKLRAAG